MIINNANLFSGWSVHMHKLVIVSNADCCSVDLNPRDILGDAEFNKMCKFFACTIVFLMGFSLWTVFLIAETQLE